MTKRLQGVCAEEYKNRLRLDAQGTEKLKTLLSV